MIFQDENSKSCSAFYFTTLKNIFGKFKTSQNNPDIALEFESRGFLENHVFFPTEQAGIDIC